MRNSMPRLIALAALAGSALFAQDITGTWQGTLQTPQQALRIVIKVSKADTGLKAVLYSIDQGGGQGIGGTVTQQGPAVKMSVPGIGGSYEGKLDSDGVILVGTWTQGPSPMPLNLKHVTSETAWPIPEAPAPPKRMAADANPAFDVASIKPSKPDQQGKGITVRGQELLTINTSLSDIMTFVYGVHPRQIAAGPAWLDSDKYDIVAKPEGEGLPSQQQLKTMLEKLMADRFKLAFHRDKKELSVYAITVGKTGTKITKSEADPNGLPGLGFRGLGDLIVRNANMTEFAGLMQSAVLDLPVVDQTGLSGRFDFTLKWTPEEGQFASMGVKVPPPSDDPAAAPNLFTAIQEQLGLRLVATKAQAEILVIDHVERPSAN